MSQDAPDAEFVRWLFAQNCAFVTGAASLDSLPPDTLPEVAFAGRSNVGKSSLLNALTGRNSLARTSHTPGRTQQLNFFDLAGRLLLVDMPGYGYARASKTDIAAWTNLVRTYLKGRATLRRLCLLVDSRHGLKDSDIEMMEMLDTAAVVYQIVLTKTDKLSKGKLEACEAEIAETLRTHPAALPEIIATSARTGDGVGELRTAIAGLASDGADGLSSARKSRDIEG